MRHHHDPHVTAHAHASLPGSWAAIAATVAAGWALTACQLRHRTRQLQLAQRDPVTGLLTRAAWETAAHHALRHHTRMVGVVDLDGFKGVNDTHGHHTGDLVLRAVAARLTAVLGPAALVGRLGGDEFAFVTGLSWLHHLDHLQDALAAPIPGHGSAPLRVGASLGVAVACSVELPAALAAADRAMYQAKSRRRTRSADNQTVRLPRARRPHHDDDQVVMNR
ncbi:GGDEF domain-containing protein [Saccharopolyspora indica]|uniref:GGDEF domain-containing protein n=1 Tax=Saccharopolyspora indica TaxID=1229659 RepID=UPI0022EACE4F|nr:GGDEF domain-containing protein [Saccharopolyspora indica]MDA3644392.1 GGDEF domain-containing protein [Saccharopolyspora indica]